MPSTHQRSHRHYYQHNAISTSTYLHNHQHINTMPSAHQHINISTQSSTHQHINTVIAIIIKTMPSNRNNTSMHKHNVINTITHHNSTSTQSTQSVITIIKPSSTQLINA